MSRSYLEDFDFSVLDSSSFKEDSVREEIIAPLLRALGYRPSGEHRVERSKALVHPFVMIGTRRHPVNIIPDYTLYGGTNALMIIDAKHPAEDIVSKSEHREQAYSYAIHPEIRSHHYALCNGRVLAVYSTQSFEPSLVLDVPEISARWHDVVSHLRHDYLEKPFLRKFHPDFGLHVQLTGGRFAEFTIQRFQLAMISRITMTKWSASAAISVDDASYMLTVDFDTEQLTAVLGCLPEKELVASRASLGRSPFVLYIGGKISVDAKAPCVRVVVASG